MQSIAASSILQRLFHGYISSSHTSGDKGISRDRNSASALNGRCRCIIGLTNISRILLVLQLCVCGCLESSHSSGDHIHFTPQNAAAVLPIGTRGISLPIQFYHTLSGAVHIKLLSKSCGCMMVVMPSNPVPPKSPRYIYVNISSSYGKTMQSIIVELLTADGKIMRREISFQCTIYPSWDLYPKRILTEWDTEVAMPIEVRLVHYHSQPGSSNPESIRVNDLPKELSLVGIRKNGPDVTVSHGMWKSEFIISLATRIGPCPDAKVGGFAISVGNETGSGLPVHYEWLESKAVVVSSPIQDFGDVPLGSVATRRCLLIARHGLLPHIEGFNSSSDNFSATILQETNNKKAAIISIMFRPKSVGEHHGKLQPQSSNTDVSRLLVEVSGRGIKQSRSIPNGSEN